MKVISPSTNLPTRPCKRTSNPVANSDGGELFSAQKTAGQFAQPNSAPPHGINRQTALDSMFAGPLTN